MTVSVHVTNCMDSAGLGLHARPAPAPFTTCVNGALFDGLLFASPAYIAPMLCGPAVRTFVVNATDVVETGCRTRRRQELVQPLFFRQTTHVAHLHP